MVSKNPLKSLLNSRKFWVLLWDLIASFTFYFVAKYAKIALEDVKFVILGLQPMFLLIVFAIYGQNVQNMKSQAEVESSRTYYMSEHKITEINDLLKRLEVEKVEKAEISDSLILSKTQE